MFFHNFIDSVGFQHFYPIKKKTGFLIVTLSSPKLKKHYDYMLIQFWIRTSISRLPRFLALPVCAKQLY